MKPPAIPLEKITALTPIYEAVIPPEYRDENGHMNVRWYMTIFDDAGYPMAEQVGISWECHQAHGTGGFDLEHHIHYLREVHIGDRVVVYPRFVARSAKRMHYLLFMVNHSRGTLAAIFECINSFADLTQRRTAPFPPHIAEKLDALIAQHTALDWDAPTCGVMNL